MRLGFIAFAAALTIPVVAQAGGFEYAAGGARPLGRAGAYHVRSDDPLAIQYNPANLSLIEDLTVSADLNVAFFGACTTREGFYDAGSGSPGSGSTFDDFADQPFPEVCNSGPPGPSPYVLLATPLADNLGLSVGIISPAAAGTLEWGDEDHGVEVNGQNYPVPTRYILTRQELVLFWPSVGIGWAPIPELRIGATFTWGISFIDYESFVVPVKGENPGTDTFAEMSVQDLFIPGGLISVTAAPTPWLELTAGFRINDVNRAGGDMVLTYAQHGNGTETKPTVNRYTNIELDAPIPWAAWAGVRYALQRDSSRRQRGTPSAAGLSTQRVNDSMENEVFDVELDAIYEISSRVDEFRVRTPTVNGLPSVFNATDVLGGMDVPTAYTVPRQINVAHRWNDQLALRLGGDWNVLPGKLAVRAGVSFETSGVPAAYHGIDFFPDQRVGIHLGATMRFERIDVSLGYAHHFNETVEVSMAEAKQPQISSDEMGVIVNAGTYTSHFDVFALGGTFHF